MFGKVDGAPVLALHGWLDNSASFDRLAPLLTWARVVALDLPGHGWSAHRSADAPYALIDWVPDVFRAADAMGWEQFHLLGHSLGGCVACLAAGTFPERVKSLMLIDSIGGLVAPAEEAPNRLQHHMRAAKRLRSKAPARYASVEQALDARMKTGRYDHPEGLRRVVERGLLPETSDGQTTYVWRTDPRLTLPSPFRLTLEHIEAFLRRIACPTLLIHADDGIPLDEKTRHAYVASVSKLEVREVVGGHHVHLDHPEAVASLLAAFQHA